MIKIGLAATNDAAGLDNKNVSAFIELAQKNDCEVIKGESAFFEPEEAKRVANGLKDCDLIVVTVKGFTWFGECINEFTKLGVPVCCWAVPEPKKEGVLLFNSMTGLNLFTSVANSGREIPAVKWLYGNADDTLFVNRFLTTVGAIRCLKAIKGKKIAIAGGVAEGFVNLEYDKKKVESRFGITIEETDIDKIIDAVLEMKDTPKVGEGEILIKIEAAGICASDRAVYMGGDPWGGIESPRVPGHEFVGTVEEIGPGAEEKGFVRGDRVTAECIMPCGKCYYCKKGLYHLCDDENGFLEGGFAEYMLLPKNALIHKVSKDIPAVEAALCEPLSCSAYAVNQTGMGMEDTVVVSGLGAIGMGMLQFALLRNPKRVIGIDTNDALCEIAKKLGAAEVLNPMKEDVTKRIMELTDGVGCDIYMEATGNPASVETGMNCLRKQGMLFIYSVFKKKAEIDLNQISEFKELRVIGGHLSPGAFPYTIDCLEKGKINAKVMVTDIFALNEIDEAMSAKKPDRVSIKTVLVP